MQNAREIVGETFLTFSSVLAHVTSLDMHEVQQLYIKETHNHPVDY